MDRLFIVLLLQILFLIPILSARSGNETDRVSLLEFKAKIEDDPLSLLGSWNESAHFCSWPGVACSRRHPERVTMLDLQSWKLTGQLSPHVGNLSFVRRLNLGDNSFRLEIPPEIGRLFRLRALYLQNNSFSGEIPANISRCSSLEFLSMLNNNLSGGITKDIGWLTGLRVVELSGNNLAGKIPASFGNLSSLTYANLRSNNLHGNIPEGLGQLKSLKLLVLGDNNFTGTIPLSLYNVSRMEYFDVSNNKLEGNLPSNLGHTLPNLQYFLFYLNDFSGSIPATISNTSNLVLFQIYRNKFTGKVPSFARALNLQTIGLADNSLGYAENDDSKFLDDLVNCTNLQNLVFSNNNLGGKITDSLSNMTSLTRVAFGGNQISGNIPAGIGNLVNLKLLAFEANHLTGPIPSTVGRLRETNILALQENKLSGTIPSTLRNLTLLSKLILYRNNIQGRIPSSLGECISLRELNLAENNLSGTIPSQVMKLQSMSIELDLSRNQLTGSIPTEVERLVNLGRLDISENKLSGEIPNALGNCTSIEYLYMQGNFLEGSVPEELKSLKGVQEIDLSRNKLSGKIPDYFADFRALAYLNLSFNDFEGQVPQQGIFKNASRFSIIGNTRLCGGLSELKLRICMSHARKNRKLSPKIRYIIIASCAIIAILIILFLAMIACYLRKRSNALPVEPSVGTSLPRASYADLSKATDGFSSKNLIGIGSFGSVYRGTLNLEEPPVAVKVLNLQVSRALKTFIAECESLGTIKHRNLVKLLTVCSSIDFHGNDFKALVFEFMENGNLKEWLHSSRVRVSTGREQSHSLNFIQRVSITVDVASALNYLHNDCPEPIAHCDIKPSNILLDGHMVARVGDFGLSKLLGNASIHSSNQTGSSGIRGTVGYAAPEYAMGSEASTLGDIYSFGILLLELFIGKRPTDGMFKDELDLHNFASMALPDGISAIMDPTLLEGEGRDSENAISRCDDHDQTIQKALISIVEIGVACSSKFPVARKSICDAAAELRRIRDSL